MKTSKSKTSSKAMSAQSLDVNKNMSCSIRKIENGFLVSESGYVGKGRNQQYVSKEYFTPNNPVASVKMTSVKMGGRK